MARRDVVVWEIAGRHPDRETQFPVLHADHDDGAGFGFVFGDCGGCETIVAVKIKRVSLGLLMLQIPVNRYSHQTPAILKKSSRS